MKSKLPKTIEEILSDLYEIDPALRLKEKELRVLVAELLSSRPEVSIDADFVARLRSDLLQKKPAFSFFSYFERMPYGVAGAFLLFVIIAPLAYYYNSQGISLSQNITRSGSEAFGPLALESVSSSIANDSGARAMSFEKGTEATAPSLGMVAPYGLGSDAAGSSGSASLAYPVEAVSYSYVYAGEPLQIPEKGEVFKRQKGIDAGINSFTSFFRKNNFGIADLSSFSSLKMRNVELSEDKEFGYSVSINFEEGLFSVNPNWQRWGTRTYEPGSFSALSDDEVISLANRFLREHGITSDAYGAPVVENPWGDIRPLAADSSLQVETMPVGMASEGISVLYPLQINGMPVKDEGGGTLGMRVSINIPEKRVSSVWDVSTQTYESSEYDLLTDQGAILERLQKSNGGYFEGGKILELSLGTPERTLMRYWRYGENTSTELYIPALSFPVLTDVSGRGIWIPKEILVPLIRDLPAEPSYEGKPMPLENQISQ